MNWNLLPYFVDEQVTGNIITVVDGENADGFTEETEVLGADIKGLLWSISVASRYFSVAWNEAVTQVLVVADVTGINNTDKIRFNGLDYEVDSIDDVATQGDEYLIGLKGRR